MTQPGLFGIPAAPETASAPPPALPLTGLDLALADYLQAAQPSPDARHRLLAALVSHQFGRGHACLDLRQLQSQGVQALGWDRSTQALLPPGLCECAPALPWAEGEGSPLVLDGPRLYLRRNWSAEQSILAALRARLDRPCPVPEGLAQALALLFPTPAGGDSGEPDWQKLACALATRACLTVITGGPGTGKTTTVVRLLALLQSGAVRCGAPLRVALAAPTGKAAARLGESIAGAIARLPPALQALKEHLPTQALTLHRLLQARAGDAAAPALGADLVVVDEASMIDLDMMARLLAAVPQSARLVLLGDKDQLSSVEAGAVMGQLCAGADAGRYTPATVAWARAVAGADLRAWAGAGSALAQQTVMLRHSRRFAAGSGIGQWARAVNEGDVAAARRLWQRAPAWGAGAADVDRLPPDRAPQGALMALVRLGWQPCLARMGQGAPCDDAQALHLLAALARFQVLCAVREGPWGVQTLNRRIAAALGFVDEGWYAGRPVMVTRNDYALGLMNGDLGLCLPHARGLRVAFPDGRGGVRWVLPSRLDAVESVFAMTVHKSQGSEFDHVVLVLPDTAVAVLTRELLYTGITRARQRLSLAAPREDLLWRAVQTRVVRSGGLAAVHGPGSV